MRLIVFVLACRLLTWAQPQPSVLIVDVDQGLFYSRDNADWTKYATEAGPIPQVMPVRNFQAWEGIGDIVAINGKPVKGTWHSRAIGLTTNPNPQPGQAIADVARTGTLEWIMEILTTDGLPIGTIMGYGWNGGPPPPGAPARMTPLNTAITGGTGAYAGIRGQMGINSERAATAIPTSRMANASMVEDPARRRVNGQAQTRRHVLQVFPMMSPEVLPNNDGTMAVRTADNSPVTMANPARAGDVLTLAVANMGPVTPNLEFGLPFPAEPLAAVNSPVEVIAGGRESEVLNQVGWPGTTNRFRVDFRVPEGLPSGLAEIQVRSAFVGGPVVRIPVR